MELRALHQTISAPLHFHGTICCHVFYDKLNGVAGFDPPSAIIALLPNHSLRQYANASTSVEDHR